MVSKAGRDKVRVKIIGHRGSSAAPENTLAAFEAAVKEGVDTIECDVRRCKTGELVVIHDKDVVRVWNGSGLVKELSLAQLKKLRARRAQIPTLEEALHTIPETVMMFIELKEKNLEKDAIRLVKKRQQTVLISFDPNVIRAVKERDKTIRTGLVTKTVNSIRLAKAVKADYVLIEKSVCTKKYVTAAHAAKLQVVVWVVNMVVEAKRFAAMGVEGIATDEPKKLVGKV